MPRPPKYSTEAILDAAGEVVLEHWREATVAQVAERVGAPSGSVYHRFASRDALFGALWARSIRRFHEGLLVAARLPDGREAMAALAVHIPRFCRENRADAKAMALYRLPDLLDRLPEASRPGLAAINDDVDTALREVVARRFGRVDDDLTRLALIATRQCPYGLVRPLVGDDIPAELDDMCKAAAEGILALADRPGRPASD